MTARIGLGPSDFRQLREEGIYYVDKSRLLVELLGDPDQVLLFPRPRRFGKTLNLSMLRYFLEKSDEDRRPLFDDLAVWQSAEAQSHFGRYPVIFLTFKDAKASSFDSCMKAIRLLLAEAFARHRYLLGSAALTPEQASGFRSVIEGSAEEELCWRSLYDLTKAMASYHGEKAVVLIDEYDAPIHAGYANGYYDQVVAFFRNLLSAVLKDNPCLFKGVLTGVLRIAKESLSSGLNNVKVRSILSLRFADAFGFTEAEVRTMVEAMERPEVAEQIACWYDGYRFGETKIYNPWSVLSYAADPQDGFRPYWVFTSAEDVLRPQVLEQQAAVAGGIELLLRGDALICEVTEHLVLRDLDRNANAIWSLLLHSGYLTPRSFHLEGGAIVAELVLPNREMRYVFERSITRWVEDGLNGRRQVEQLLQAMLQGDEASFTELLTTLVLRTFSYQDTGGPEPERVYQAFLLGMLVLLEPGYEVRSNRESGYGRYDVMVLPKKAGQPGVVIECKQQRRLGGETVEQALDSAMQQIAERRYPEELAARGASPILCYGIVFDGKRVWVRREDGPGRESAS